MAAKRIEAEPLLTYEELARVLNLTVSFLKKAKREYGLPSYKLGDLVRFKLSEVQEWISQRKA